MPVTEAYVEPEPSPTLSGAASIISTILVNKDECVFGTLIGNGFSGYLKNRVYTCFLNENTEALWLHNLVTGWVSAAPAKIQILHLNE